MKLRIGSLIVLIFFDIFIMPYILKLPINLNNNDFDGWKDTVISHPFLGPMTLYKDNKLKEIWFYSQPLIFAGIVAIFFSTRMRGQQKKGGLGGPDAAGSGQFGTARWLTDKEIESVFNKWDLSRPLKTGGFVVGAKKSYKNFFTYLNTEDTHCLVIGATRTGKSRRVLLPTIYSLARAGESMITTDIKKELYYHSADMLRSIGYKVVLIDFDSPKCGNRWNTIHTIINALKYGDYAGASKAAQQLAYMITYQDKRPEDFRDPLWPQTQKSLTAAMALAIASDAPNECKHFYSVFSSLIRLGEKGGKKLDNYFKSLDENHVARIAYGVANMAEDRLRNGIFVGGAGQLELWADPGVAWITAEQDHDLAGPGYEKTATFLVIPDEESYVDNLVGLYVNQSYNALSQLARRNGGRLEKRVNFLLDEFGNLPPLPNFTKKLTLAGGKGMRFLLAVQGLDQIKKKYKEDEFTIRGNCATWVYIATADYHTAELISARTGQYTQSTESISSNVRKTEYSQGMTQGLAGRRLLLPDEVLRWPKGKSLVTQLGNNPAELELPDLSEWPIQDTFKNKKHVEIYQREAINYPPVWVPKVNIEKSEEEEVAATSEVIFDI